MLGVDMVIVIREVPREERPDLVINWLRASIWARVEGRPYCVVTLLLDAHPTAQEHVRGDRDTT
jgi:hypothetical protein